MAVDIPAIREVVERVFARQDVLNACRRRNISMPITVLCANGVTQAQIATITGIPQGRISEYKTRKHVPTATSTFEAFASLGLPPAARLALGLAPETAGSDPLEPARGQTADRTGASLGGRTSSAQQPVQVLRGPGALGSSRDPWRLCRSGPTDGVHVRHRPYPVADAGC
jgi:transcriptional regulator with XRE-family HTH domain